MAGSESPQRWRARGAAGVAVATAFVVLLVLLVLGVTGSITTVMAIVAFVGAVIAFAPSDRGAPTRPEGVTPDQHMASMAEHVLGSLDGIEHRRVELGRPWPQLSVGPVGVAVVDVCGIDGPLLLDASGLRRRGDRGPCARCSSARSVGAAARRALAERASEVSVRIVVVVAVGTEVILGPGAPPDVRIVTVDTLADALARGPVLPMPVVDAAFTALTAMEAFAEPR